MKKIAVSSLVSLLFLSCSVSVPNNGRIQYAPTGHPSLQTPLLGGVGVGSLHPSLNFSDLEKEYKSFSTKALSDAYVKRMFGKYLSPVNTTQLIRQLEFSRYLKNNGDTSYETSLKSMFAQTPSLYDAMTGISAPDIQNKMLTESATFGTFVTGLSPYASNPIATSATDITRISFTANWNTVSNATGYKLYISDGTNTSSTNITGNSTLSYPVTGLMANKTYSYYIKAVNQNGDSPASNTISVTTISKIVFASGSDLYTINPDGTGLFRVTTNGNNTTPKFSPDGSKIAYPHLNSTQWDIYKINSDGTGNTRVTNFTAYDEDYPDWSADSNTIFYQIFSPTNVWDVAKINSDGSFTGYQNLTGSTTNEYIPAVSPDGTKIAYVYDTGSVNAREIYVMNTDGSSKTRLINNSAQERDAEWTPDGNNIIFTSYRDNASNGMIYIMDKNGTNQTRLTFTGSSRFPNISPDGSKIVFYGTRGSNTGLFIMNSDGSDESNPLFITSIATATTIDWK